MYIPDKIPAQFFFSLGRQENLIETETAAEFIMHEGEVRVRGQAWQNSSFLKVTFEWENTTFEFPLKALGGRYFVAEYRNTAFFKYIHLQENLQNEKKDFKLAGIPKIKL